LADGARTLAPAARDRTSALLLWADLFATVSIFRFTERSMDRRLSAIEEHLASRSHEAG
jgi:hypothetical protein